MPDSPLNSTTQKRLCDFCSESVALVYCKADSAKLCLSCDREVHSTNQLFTKHTRFQLCDVCDSSAASILCLTEHSVLCQNCDYEHHSLPGISSNHDRRPLEGFTGCPSVLDLSAAVGFEDFDAKSCVIGDESDNHGVLFSGLEQENDGFSDFFVWDVPTMVSLDDLIVTTDKTHNFQATVVPPLPKDRNVSCGQHKREILRQLCELAKAEPSTQQDTNPPIRHHIVADEEKDSIVHQKIRVSQRDDEPNTYEGNEASPYTWCNDADEGGNDVFISSTLSGSHIEESVLFSETQSSMHCNANLATNGWNSQHSVRNESLEFSQRVPIRELLSADRDSALSRYKEKKRTRRFEKHIRYESRKLQAENRTRIKGRFAKLDNRVNQA
ncbi:unnamed protein product [Amaranthus hypochondriacus]